MRLHSLLPALLYGMSLLPLNATAQAQGTCSHHLFVSGYFSSNVEIYDACSGAHVRTLDTQSRIQGAQAVRQGPDGMIYVVSEGNDRILRYRGDNYEFVDVFSQFAANIDPTGLDFGPDGSVYVASYGTDSVLRLNGQTGVQIGVAVASTNGLDGPDNGMGFDQNDQLLIPGYDSNSIARFNPATNQLQVGFVSAGSGGLRQTRGIALEPGGGSFLVTGEGSGAVYRYRLSDGAFLETLITGLNRPTGIALAPDGSLLVLAAPARITRHDRLTGAQLGVVAFANQNGISGGTFLALVVNAAAATVDGTQIGSQYWVFGSGTTQARSLSADMVSANGGQFGTGFNPADVVRKRWGSVQIEFTACDRARFTYDSTGANSANFGRLSYDVVRLVDSEATLVCRTQGFAQATGRSWMSGAWYGLDRSGEGLVLEVAADGTAIASFYTHLPQGF